MIKSERSQQHNGSDHIRFFCFFEIEGSPIKAEQKKAGLAYRSTSIGEPFTVEASLDLSTCPEGSEPINKLN